jgi:hypothetical protein
VDGECEGGLGDELIVGHGAVVLAEHPLDDCGLGRCTGIVPWFSRSIRSTIAALSGL